MKWDIKLQLAIAIKDFLKDIKTFDLVQGIAVEKLC